MSPGGTYRGDLHLINRKKSLKTTFGHLASPAICLSVLVACVCLLTCSPQAQSLYPASDEPIEFQVAWQKTLYQKRIVEFKSAPIGKDKVVLVGNSLTEGGKNWNQRFGSSNIVNRGISGDITEGVLARLDEVFHYQPQAVFLLIGINDIFDANHPRGNEITPQYVAENIHRIANSLKQRLPATKVFIQTILPVNKAIFQASKGYFPEHAIPLREQINEINELLKKQQVFPVIDLHAAFADDAGILTERYTSDGVHLTEAGYALWSEVLKPYIEPFLNQAELPQATSALSLPALFGDGMVLQQNDSVAIWGAAGAGQAVRISASWDNEGKVARTDSDGRWEGKLETPAAGGPFELLIQSENSKIIIRDVLIGEVWLASGQSNMEMDFAYSRNTTDSAETELTTANYPQIRMFTVEKNAGRFPVSEVKGSWQKAVAGDISGFSAAAYFFAKKLHKELDVPIGILHASWGGSSIEAWSSREAIKSASFLDKSLAFYDSLAEATRTAENWFSRLESMSLPGIGWEFFLDAETHRHDPHVNYASFFLEQWQQIDFKDGQFLEQVGNHTNWPKINIPAAIADLFGTGNFKGVTLLKRDVTIEQPDQTFLLEINPQLDVGWDLFEVEAYINGQPIGSTFKDLDDAGRRDFPDFPKRFFSAFEIPAGHFHGGTNEIALRVIGAGEIRDIVLTAVSGREYSLTGEWAWQVTAEIYRQFRGFVFPYQSFYLYNDPDLDLADRPQSFASYVRFQAYSSLFNGMIAPLIPYGIKGVIWYQGESNAGAPDQYQKLFPAMVKDWRERWNRDLPFYYAQIAPYFNYGGASAAFRDAQRKCLDLIHNSGMLVTMDIGEVYDIHPSNKHDVGKRFADLALAGIYNRNHPASGPAFKQARQSGNQVIVDFAAVVSGLLGVEDELRGFELAAENGKYKPVSARISGNQVVLDCSNVKDPVWVRYAWSDTSQATLFNREGLPASTFEGPVE